MQGGSLYHFYDGLWYDPAERRTHDLPWERRTRYRLSQPDTVQMFWKKHVDRHGSLNFLQFIFSEYIIRSYKTKYQIFVAFINKTLKRNKPQKCIAQSCFSTNAAILSPNHITSGKRRVWKTSISPSDSASHWSFAYYNGIVGNTSVADGALILHMIT